MNQIKTFKVSSMLMLFEKLLVILFAPICLVGVVSYIFLKDEIYDHMPIAIGISLILSAILAIIYMKEKAVLEINISNKTIEFVLKKGKVDRYTLENHRFISDVTVSRYVNISVLKVVDENENIIQTYDLKNYGTKKYNKIFATIELNQKKLNASKPTVTTQRFEGPLSFVTKTQEEVIDYDNPEADKDYEETLKIASLKISRITFFAFIALSPFVIILILFLLTKLLPLPKEIPNGPELFLNILYLILGTYAFLIILIAFLQRFRYTILKVDGDGISFSNQVFEWKDIKSVQVGSQMNGIFKNPVIRITKENRKKYTFVVKRKHDFEFITEVLFTHCYRHEVYFEKMRLGT